MNILFIGDIVGKVGRRVVKDYLPQLKEQNQIDFVIANGENVTHGKGLSSKHYNELISYGIDAITMGNHYFRVQEVLTNNKAYPNMVRPYNLYKSVPGVGTRLFTCKGKTIRVTNLLGRVFLSGVESNPFECLQDIIEGSTQDIHIVDFHAEATGEKLSLAWAFDGQVSAVIGTHTHVQTNDNKILPKGTCYLSDAGMCGYKDSILGVYPDEVVKKTWTNYPYTFKIPSSGPGQLNGILLSIDDATNKVTSSKLINIIE